MTKEEEIAKLRADKENIELMLNSKGWQAYSALVKATSVAQRGIAFNAAMDSMDALVRVAYHKAISDGLLLGLTLPDILIEDARVELKIHYEEEGN